PPPPIIGAAPPEGKGDAGALPTEAVGLAPLTGGNAGSFAGAADWPGNGAGNAPCASAELAVAESTASVSGTIKRLIIKAFLRRDPTARGYSAPGVFTIPAAR